MYLVGVFRWMKQFLPCFHNIFEAKDCFKMFDFGTDGGTALRMAPVQIISASNNRDKRDNIPQNSRV